jgi:hypothetical protein
MSGRGPNESLYYTREEALYLRQRPPPPRPLPNNVGVILVGMMVLAILVALVLFGPGLIEQVRHMAYCMNHGQEAAC